MIIWINIFSNLFWIYVKLLQGQPCTNQSLISFWRLYQLYHIVCKSQTRKCVCKAHKVCPYVCVSHKLENICLSHKILKHQVLARGSGKGGWQWCAISMYLLSTNLSIWREKIMENVFLQ